MRRPSSVELMLLATIGLWSLNITVTRYVLTHGFRPLPYATVRYGLAAAVFAAMALAAERSLRLRRADVRWAALAALMLVLNQVAFVLALERTAASVIALVLGATPIFAALVGLLLGTEAPSSRFWAGAAVSFAGVGLVAAGSGDVADASVVGVLLGVVTAVTWAGYSVAVAPLMRSWSPTRISAVVLAAAWVPIALLGVPQTAGQDWSLGWEIWALLVFATLGPLVVTNVLWFRSLHRIGVARATLAANLQPFAAAVVALLLLGESMAWLQVAGGALVAAGILLARRRG